MSRGERHLAKYHKETKRLTPDIETSIALTGFPNCPKTQSVTVIKIWLNSLRHETALREVCVVEDVPKLLVSLTACLQRLLVLDVTSLRLPCLIGVH